MSTEGLAAQVAAEVRAEQARQRLSGRDLAQRVGLPTSTVARKLRGATPMDLDDVQAFAVALGLPVTELIARATPAERFVGQLESVTKRELFATLGHNAWSTAPRTGDPHYGLSAGVSLPCARIRATRHRVAA